ncbi:hypothetical protein PPYR_10685 [Photinus pyralis]|uniref:Uncharacterized protein n=1 Tax=Photinus pyralis TaxID=7054 RepID=A0A5N4AH42_PHOPY|nr:hypothetical protein PPYR_10685 [Photinus pyralis]
MIEQSLSMVTHLVQCKCNGTINCQKSTNGELKHDDLALKEPISTVCSTESTAFMTWNSILKGLVSHCTQLSACGRDTFSNAFALNWRQTDHRKVLAPLALKQNADNIIAGNLAIKRKSTADLEILAPPSKKPKLDVTCDTLNSCSVSLKRTSARNLILQYKCVSKIPFVKLFDVLKEIPQEKQEEKTVDKNDFMSMFELDTLDNTNTKTIEEVKTTHPIKLTKTVAIPFSSIYGRKLLLRERHCLPEDVALKKIERTDWYLNRDAPRCTNHDYPVVSYDKRSRYTRTYTYPKRQFYQKHKSLKQHFLEYVCKPVCVRLERINVSSFVNKPSEPVQQRTISEATIVSAVDDFASILETNSIICETVLSDSDLVNAKSVDLENLVGLADDDCSKCLGMTPYQNISNFEGHQG